MTMRFAWLIIALLLFSPLAAQVPSPDLPQRLDTEWILLYEQSFSVPGLYVDEPPVELLSAQVRRDLVTLTRAGREYTRQFPGEPVTPERLLVAQLIKDPILPPDGVKYAWSPETRRFLSSTGGMQDIVIGAMIQLQQAEEYRRRVASPSLHVWKEWNELLEKPDLPELIRREIEVRQVILRQLESGPARAARQTQEQLQQLNDAIEMATALGKLEPGQEITMQDVARTGLIDLLPALPLNGKYKVTKVGEPPIAVFGETEVTLDPEHVHKRLKYEAAKAYRARPDYPPVMAAGARYLEPAEGLAMMNRAIEIWPDVPALHVQRLAMNAQMFNIAAMREGVAKAELRGYLDAISADLEYLMARFPAAPILLEVDAAISKGALEHDMQFRGSIAETMANIRPEVLNAQVMALKYLTQAGETERARRIYDRLIDRHPGYEPLLPKPGVEAAATANP